MKILMRIAASSPKISPAFCHSERSEESPSLLLKIPRICLVNPSPERAKRGISIPSPQDSSCLPCQFRSRPDPVPSTRDREGSGEESPEYQYYIIFVYKGQCSRKEGGMPAKSIERG
jgi:hypothetical protein